MPLERIKPEIKNLFNKNIPVTDYIHDESQQYIASTRSCIPECLQIHKPAEWRIEEVYQRQDEIPYAMEVLAHKVGKVTCLTDYRGRYFPNSFLKSKGNKVIFMFRG